MRSLEQIRAEGAYLAVDGANEASLRLAIRMPEMVQMNGLLATVAFLLAKGKEEHQWAGRALLDHLRRPELGLDPGGDGPLDVAFRRWVGQGGHALSGSELMTLTGEALAFGGWLKRAAQAAGGADE